MKDPEGQKAPAPAPAPAPAVAAPQVAAVQHAISPSLQSVELSGAGAVDDSPSRSQQSAELVQLDAGGAGGEAVQQAAARGIAGASQSLPHLDAIQGAFGQHDVSGVQAHVGGAAEVANAEMGSAGFATGNHVAFKGEPDLHTAAHEAAHVVQQRQGVSLKGGVGQAGDPYEQHADAVADLVVQGKSAETLLSSGPGGGASEHAVQHRLDGPVQFDDPPAAGAGPAPLTERIRTALDDGEEQEAIRLMGQCTPAQANAVLRAHQDLATSCFGNDTMGAACRALVRQGGSLAKALEWSFDEGTDFAILSSIIRACSDMGQRRALGNSVWRDRFVGELGNDEMAALVDLLGLTLANKIRWMDEEGTSWEALEAKISVAPQNERAELRDNAWLPYFTRMCGNDEMAVLVDLLGGDLVWKLKWMNEEGTDWAAMRIRIEAAPPEQRLKVYDHADLQAMFVSECNDEEMIAAVGLLGGPLAKRIAWCAAEGATSWEQILGVIQTTPETERTSIYGDAGVTAVFADLKEEEVIEAMRLCGGTPTDKLKLWGARPIDLMLPLISPADDWAAGLLATGHTDDLLRLAAGTDGPAWKTAVDNQTLIDDVISGATPTSEEDTYRGLYTLFGDATTRTRAQMDAIFPKLFAQTQLRKAGEITNVAYSTGITHTDGSGRAYRVAKRPIPVDPSDAGFAAFFNIMQRVSRMAAAATNTLQFAAQEEFYWWETAPVASTEYHRWSTPVLRDIPTSYAGSGVVTIQVYGTGAQELGQVVAANGAVTNSGVWTPMNQGDVVGRRAGADENGVANSVGGGEDRTATGGDDNRTAAITYFQNHAIHEFGHSTGVAKYTNVPVTGNDFATTYGGWEGGKSADDFKAAYWTLANAPAATPDELVDPTDNTITYPVTADDVAAWLTAVVSTGVEPTGNTVTAATTGLGKNAKLDMIASVPRFAGEKMFKYVKAVLGHATIAGAKANAYQFSGYTPVGDVWIYATRNVGGHRGAFARYDNEAYVNCVHTLGWYSLSSPVEMFAESFTSKYAGGGVPASRGAGKDFNEFFTQLQNSPSIETVAGATPGTMAAPPGAPAAGEVEPPSNIVPA